MMEEKYHITLTAYALNQLEEIKQYIVYELAAPEAAKKLLKLMYKTIMSLDTMPSRNPMVDEEPWKSAGIRKIFVKNYILYYWIDEAKKEVVITATVYGKRDQNKQLTEMDMQ